MDQAVQAFIEQRRKSWKQRLKQKLGRSKDIHEAMQGVLGEYLYYFKNRSDLRKRCNKLATWAKWDMRYLPATRKTYARDAKKLEKIFDWLRKKLQSF